MQLLKEEYAKKTESIILRCKLKIQHLTTIKDSYNPNSLEILTLVD